jgi:hypothetical protein
MSLLRRFSSRLSPSNRREKSQRRIQNEDFERNQRKIERDLVEAGNSLVNYNSASDIIPSTRNGARLFSTGGNNMAETGQDMDRTLYEMPMPENVDAMTDLLKLHKDGDKFPYIGIVGSEGETVDARRARMLAIKPSLGLRNIPEIEVTGCPLIDLEGEFSMSSLMDYAVTLGAPTQTAGGLMPVRTGLKNYSITKPYIHIKSVTGLYTPNMSSSADFCKLWFVLIDNRLVNRNKSGQSNALVSNQEGVLEMSCDYCVSKDDLGNFILGYTLEREIMKPGFQWGTISFYFNITESDMPYQSAKKDALAVYRMPITTLNERETNADKADISFTSRDVVTMRKLYLSGDIVDVDEPQKERVKKSVYSKSTLRGAPKGEEMSKPTSKDWDFMKGARKPMMDAEIASVDVESADDDDESDYKPQAKEKWEAHQERLREMHKGEGKELVGRVEDGSDDEPEIMKRMKERSLDDKLKNKTVGFQVQDV